MGYLDDTLADAVRTLPRDLVVHRAVEEEAVSDQPSTEHAPQPGALTVYRFQKGGDPSPSAPTAPRPVNEGASTGTRRAGFVVTDALLPLVSPQDGLATGERSTSSRSEAEEGFDASSPVNPASSHQLKSIMVRDAEFPTEALDREQTIARDDGSIPWRSKVGGATSSERDSSVIGISTSSGRQGGRADSTAHADSTNGNVLAAESLRIPQSRAEPIDSGFSLERAVVRAAESRGPTPMLTIGRIDVIVAAPAPAPGRAPASGDDALTSRHYARRL